jgi:redox-sensing transcriptional repressor
MEKQVVPDIVISRLPLYLQILNQMVREGYSTVSSQTIAERLGVTPTQLRKDFSYFGGFGKQGAGYQIFYLIDVLQKILHVDQIWQMALVGAGDLGRTLINYQVLARHGFEISLVFDDNPFRIGQVIGPLKVMNSDRLEKEIGCAGIKIAILTLSVESAQKIADRLVACGVRAILCYTPVTLNLPDEVKVQYVDAVQSLQKLTYYLSD